MNTQPIVIEQGQVTIRLTATGVWLTRHQIADLFGVFISAVGSNIRSILKNEILREEKVCRRKPNEANDFIELYNLEMITALAFRLHSQNAEWFREWVIEQATNPVILWKMPNMNITMN